MLDQKVRELAEERQAAAVAKMRKAEIEARLLDDPEYKAVLAIAKEHAEKADALETEIKKAAVGAYAADGNKKPHEAVAIKMFSTVSIANEKDAREWCFANFRPALKLDAKTFEKAAKDGNVPADLATVTDEPRAQIATDLSAYLQGQ